MEIIQEQTKFKSKKLSNAFQKGMVASPLLTYFNESEVEFRGCMSPNYDSAKCRNINKNDSVLVTMSCCQHLNSYQMFLHNSSMK